MTFLIFIFSIMTLFPGLTQENDIKVNLDWEHQRHQWKANWITHPTASVYDYGVFHFRRTFTLDAKPDSFIVYVSGDNRYRLWVNGIPVGLGPARGSLDYWRYETLNVAAQLKKGKNVIAAEVINLGRYRPDAQFSRQTAFILQGPDEFVDQVNTGIDTNWKVLANHAWHPIRVTRQMVHGYYVAGPTDSMQAALHPWGWQELNFDDTMWAPAEYVAPGVGRGYMHGVPWLLVPRNIPMMEETLTRIPKIARSEGMPPDPGFLTGEKPLIIGAHQSVTILLDQTHLTVGYPELIVEQGKGSRIKMIYAESLYDRNGKKRNRNEIENKEIVGYYDVFLPDGGNQRKFRPLWLRTWRYLQLEIKTADAPLVLNDLYGMTTI